MKRSRMILALVLAWILALSFGAPMGAVHADTGIKAKTGAFAAMGTDRLFLILPTEAGSSLYSMPQQGGTVTLIDTASQINDLICAADGTLYYLRYTGTAFQIAMRAPDGARSSLASFLPGQIVYSLSYYDGALYCLVDSRLTRVDSLSAQTVSDQQMSAYTIADGIVYYVSASDEVSYEKQHTNANGESVNVTSSAGMLYAMNLDGTNVMRQFDQGVSNLAVYGEYVYFHNYNDSYVVDGSPDAWLDGKLYRLNVQTNQYRLLRDGYDWNYRPVDLGLVIYQERSLSISDQEGGNPVVLYEPDPYNYIALLDDCAIIYEYNLQKLTRVPYNQTGAVQLWNGPFVTTGDSASLTPSSTTVPNIDNQLVNGDTAATTTQAPSTAANTSDSGNLVYGSSGERVRAMQTRLKELGYLSYVDGIFGDKTLRAVKQFQRAAGLKVDGIVGKNTLNRLNRSDAPEYDSSLSATDSSYIFPNSSREKLTRSEIESVNSSLWPYARNEIYARHGYSFNQSKYRTYFENKTWYHEGGFSTKDLNSIEWYNMDLIKEMEDELNSSGSSSSKPSTTSDYIFPNSSTKKLTKSQIREVDSSLWPYARNEIYARHGYKFTKSNFKNYFESKSWYRAGGFSTKDLNDIEWYNMELIRWMEENEG